MHAKRNYKIQLPKIMFISCTTSKISTASSELRSAEILYSLLKIKLTVKITSNTFTVESPLISPTTDCEHSIFIR